MTSESIPLWRKVQRQNFSRIEPLADFLELSPENRQKLLAKPRFPLNLPLRLAEKIKKNTLDDPILRQFVPLQEELASTPGFVADPSKTSNSEKRRNFYTNTKDGPSSSRRALAQCTAAIASARTSLTKPRTKDSTKNCPSSAKIPLYPKSS